MERSIIYALERVGCPTITLKMEQRIKHLYEGKDVFLWLPTGFGKSLCYEVLPFVLDDKLGRHGSVVIVKIQVSCCEKLLWSGPYSVRRGTIELVSLLLLSSLLFRRKEAYEALT